MPGLAASQIMPVPGGPTCSVANTLWVGQYQLTHLNKKRQK